MPHELGNYSLHSRLEGKAGLLIFFFPHPDPLPQRERGIIPRRGGVELRPEDLGGDPRHWRDFAKLNKFHPYATPKSLSLEGRDKGR